MKNLLPFFTLILSLGSHPVMASDWELGDLQKFFKAAKRPIPSRNLKLGKIWDCTTFVPTPEDDDDTKRVSAFFTRELKFVRLSDGSLKNARFYPGEEHLRYVLTPEALVGTLNSGHEEDIEYIKINGPYLIIETSTDEKGPTISKVSAVSDGRSIRYYDVCTLRRNKSGK